MEFNNVIKTRRSNRSYLKKEIDNSTIEQIIESARLAPSWANRQCWRFIIIKDKEKIKAISKTSIINRWLRNVPILIVACGDPTLSSIKNNIQYVIIDVAIAMEHIILSATNMGLGSCWISDFDEKKIKLLLEIPNRIRVVALTPIGYPSPKKNMTENVIKFIRHNKKRKKLKEIIRYERW
jgi:nitroreductase